MIRELTMLAGVGAFSALIVAGITGSAFAASATTVTTTTERVQTGPTSDASEDNPDEVPDSDVEAAEREIRQQLHDARMEIRRRGKQIVVSMGADILFTFDSYQVSNEGTAAARALAGYLVKHRRTTVEVNGYTDTRGTPQYNDTLSQNRANAVAQIMIQAGVDASRVTPHGFGETNLAVETPDETKEIKNRRVEVVLHFAGRHARPGRHHPRRPHHRGQQVQPQDQGQSDEGEDDEDSDQ